MSDTDAALIDHLLALEAERGRCLVEQRFDRLRELLSPRLLHTHTRGNVDDRESYLRFVGGVIRNLGVERADLRVVPLGDSAAVMHGKQVNRACRRGHEDEVITVESTVTQVWAREDDGQWRLVAFQATPLGAPPPAAR
jgi:ketosteroid isomerase-like protein